jgi:hypothetical protein
LATDITPSSTEPFNNSKCALDSKQKSYCQQIIEERIGKKFKTINVYTGSKDGWTAADFHRLCDNIDCTVTLMRSDLDECFGGLATANWNPDDI